MAGLARGLQCHACTTAMMVAGEPADEYLIGTCSTCNTPHHMHNPLGIVAPGLVKVGPPPAPTTAAIHDAFIVAVARLAANA